ncbi:MAG TPA: GntR family transcriptional regulator [Jiangellaceae bacterium]
MSDLGSIRLPSFAKRTSLREHVADALRAAIVSGDMKPGEVYSAPTLAERFGVSATPVREAMLDLAKQGLIEVIPNKGFQVTLVTDAELDQLTEIRLLLEPPAAAKAALRASPNDIAELTRLAREVVDAARDGDLIRHVEADRTFHGRLLELGGNHRLVEIVYDLRDRTRLYGLAHLAERGVLGPTVDEHLTMCEYLAAGDAQALAELVRTHIGHVRREWAGDGHVR